MLIFDPIQCSSLKAWLRRSCSFKEFELKPLVGDASPRQYFRLITIQKSYIVMVAPPDKENITTFIAIAKNFLQQGICTPEILACNFNYGFMLLSDLGDALYLNILNQTTADDLYTRALSVLQKIQVCQPRLPNNKALNSFDEASMRFELSLFIDWFLVRHLSITVNSDFQKVFEQVFKLLISSALEQPTVCIHRDYHSRNLLQLNNNQVGVLDFQDAARGPITYDVVSLLRDAYIEWPNELIDHWIVKFYHMFSMCRYCSLDKFVRWFDWLGLQRHLKILGIFARLYYRDNKPSYLNGSAIRLLNYIIKVSKKYTELFEFSRLFEQRIQMKLINGKK